VSIKDSTNTVVSEQIRSVADRTLSKYQDSFTPILLSRKARNNYLLEEPVKTHPFMSTGTGIFVRHQSKPWLITACHVINKIERDHDSAPIYLRSGDNIEPLFRDSDRIEIIRMPDEDVAAIPLFKDYSLDYSGSTFIDLDQVPMVVCHNQLRIGAYGYLNKMHKSVGKVVNPSRYLSRVGTKTNHATPSQVFLEFDRREFEGDVIDRNFVPEPNGLSGGPVFAVGTAHEIQNNSSQVGTFCGLFITQSDKGKHGSASFVPLDCLKDCLRSSTNALNDTVTS